MSEKKKFKVLIVDDEKSNLDILVHIFKDFCSVYPAKTGGNALKKAFETMPDLILLDIILPDINGFEVLEILKTDELTARIPVIIVTGLTNSEDESRGLRLGAADYITKPFNNNVVKERVKMQLEMAEQIRMIEDLGTIDEVTDIPNRKSFDHQLGVEWARAVREKNPVSLIMIEIDKISLYKNNQGLNTLLHKTADVIKSSLKRATDITTRYGDTVFAVILPNTPKDGAIKVAEGIRVAARDLNLEGLDGFENGESVTFSVGVSSREPRKGEPLSYFVVQADRNLYRARIDGDAICY
ncbi:MAG: diguanylate cyclase [Oscillospiraceae bacterium]|nr:diguanylate cyclase [Oscillospiraceae bacterium]